LELELSQSLSLINPSYTKFYLSIHVNQVHQVIFKDGTKTGYSMTTTPYVRDSSGNKIYTNSLHHYKLDQRYIYTTFSENYDDENLKPGYLASFFKNNGLTHFESYCGMVLRLGILEKITMYE
jgi:hypothetical protein